MLVNDIYEATYQETVNPDMQLDENEKTQYENEWRIHREKVARW